MWSLGNINGMDVLPASVTVKETNVLTVEEKFQSGTGSNIFLNDFGVDETIIKRVLKKVAERVKLNAYARVDFFYHLESQHVLMIEINTLPALSPSTVLFQQALNHKNPLSPKQLLLHIIDLSTRKEHPCDVL